jgi:hypothetical protein
LIFFLPVRFDAFISPLLIVHMNTRTLALPQTHATSRTPKVHTRRNDYVGGRKLRSRKPGVYRRVRRLAVSKSPRRKSDLVTNAPTGGTELFLTKVEACEHYAREINRRYGTKFTKKDVERQLNRIPQLSMFSSSSHRKYLADIGRYFEELYGALVMAYPERSRDPPPSEMSHKWLKRKLTRSEATQLCEQIERHFHFGI